MSLFAGGALLAVSLSWLAVGTVHVWPVPVLGWVPLPVMAVLAALACVDVARCASADRETRRFWRFLALACVMLAIGAVSNAYDAVGGPSLSQRISPLTLSCYSAILALSIVNMVRLPAWQRTRGEWARFTLDVCVVLITSGLLVWHFSLRKLGIWTTQTGSVLPVLTVIVVGFVSIIAFVKVAFAGTGKIDRKSLFILSIGTALSAASGSLSPLLIDRPYLSSSFAAVSTAAFTVHAAAHRQRRALDQPTTVGRRPRRFSILPYASVLATDILLVTGAGDTFRERLLVAISAVLITVLVLARQFTALLDNTRLLDTIDANYAKLQSFQDRLTEQATHDALTGLANRLLFEQRVTAALRQDEPCGVALLDLDDFKTVNDRLGHDHGDALLVGVADRLRSITRPGDTLARLGGDEFAILMPAVTADQAADIADRLITTLADPILVHGDLLTAHASIGITTSTPQDTPQEMTRRADAAMYAAKHHGGGRWNAFDQVMDEQAAESAYLINALNNALADNQLTLVYQPIVDLTDGQMIGVEALLRWHHPERGLIPPDLFIPIAERNGSIIAIGGWVLEQSCAQAAAWHYAGDLTLRKLSVNVSARQLQEPDFVTHVAEVLRRTGLDPHVLVLEITETAVLQLGPTSDALRKLHHLGVRVALDDFGTGQSSLSLLATLPVDILKVDKSFVDGILDPTPQAAIVDNLIRITDRLGIDAVVEGVETIEQADHLRHAGYRFAQGYHFSKPVPPEYLTRDAIEALPALQ